MAFLPEFESVKGKTHTKKKSRKTMAYLMRKPWKSHGKPATGLRWFLRKFHHAKPKI